MKPKTVLSIIILVLSFTTYVSGQEDISPISLQVNVYPDGSVLLEYNVESNPSKVRIDIDLFGENYNNIIIRDEEKNPLDYSENPTGVTVDSIGASEITLTYYSFDFTTKDGPIWNLNISSPTETGIFLPEGASIYDLSDIPLNLEIINNAQYILLPTGEISVSYILSIPNLSEEARSAIETADEYLTSLEEQEFILIKAREEYEAANTLYQNNQFSEAKKKALKAQETADETIIISEKALHEIAFAESAVEQAMIQGKTSGLESAIEALTSANNYHNQGLYNEAESSAKQAYQLALNAETAERNGNTLIYIGTLILVVAITGGYFLVFKKQGTEETKRARAIQIDLEKILDNHDTLRLEEREVIKFIAKNGGEVFAAEIRERFDMPRSTTWRLIRRLIEFEIVEDEKIGNQSLIRVKEEYHV
ncbi:helix-turn-helix transcriptional regulator [Thermoproteota archaeon]